MLNNLIHFLIGSKLLILMIGYVTSLIMNLDLRNFLMCLCECSNGRRLLGQQILGLFFVVLLLELFAIGEGDDISVGFVPKNYPQGRHPGWLPNSVGFHIAKGQSVFFLFHDLSYDAF